MIKFYYSWLHIQIYISIVKTHIPICVDCSTVHNSQCIESAQVPINILISVETWIYAMEFYLTIKKKTCKMSFAVKLIKLVVIMYMK